MIISRNRCIKVKVYIFKNKIEELINKLEFIEEQITQKQAGLEGYYKN